MTETPTYFAKVDSFQVTATGVPPSQSLNLNLVGVARPLEVGTEVHPSLISAMAAALQTAATLGIEATVGYEPRPDKATDKLNWVRVQAPS